MFRAELLRKPESRARLHIQATLDPHVGVMRIFPGITDDAIRSFLAPPMQGAGEKGRGRASERDMRKSDIREERDMTEREI